MIQHGTHLRPADRGEVSAQPGVVREVALHEMSSCSRAAVCDPPLRRALDIAIAILAVIFLLPLLAVIALAIWLQDGGPVLYSQTRIGRNGTLFRCLKFRTMRPNSEAVLDRLLASDPAARDEWRRCRKLRRDPRVTPLGRFLRASSLDEIPQVFNILNGSMNLVGPRPIVPEEAALYGHRIASYQSVLPGITGLWQIGGRSDVSYRRRVALDHLYVRHRNLMFDLKILVMTIPAVVLRKGSY